MSSGPRGAQLEALAGVRITDLRTEINGRHGLPKFDDDKTWVDPVIGLQGRLELTERWEAFAEGDIGGFGVGSDITWDWVAGIGYGFELFGHAPSCAPATACCTRTTRTAASSGT